MGTAAVRHIGGRTKTPVGLQCAAGKLPEALYRAARLYEQGRGVPQNLPKALEMYEPVRLHLYPSSPLRKVFTKTDFLRISSYYDSGVGLPDGPDPARALVWLELAASAADALPSDKDLRRRARRRKG